ncbi:MAG: FecR domain-containing protein [Deltaproteobacteria bacterium]|nr:FecR domain-containing protein [Deltaproteobacteria bacterium]
MAHLWLLVSLLLAVLPATAVYGLGTTDDSTKFASNHRVTVKIKQPVTSKVRIEETDAPDCRLLVETKPAGALVMMNGTEIGTSPVIVSGLYPGKVTVHIQLANYRSLKHDFTIQGNKKTKMSASLDRSGGVGHVVGRLIKLSGMASFRPVNSSDSAPLRPGLELYGGDEINTGNDGKVRILFADNSIVCLGDNTRLIISEYTADIPNRQRYGWLTLQMGKAKFFVNGLFKGFNGQSFRVQTPTAIMGVRGTVFIVRARSRITTGVVCLENQIEVACLDYPEQPVILDPNMTSDVTVNRLPSAPRSIDLIQLKQFQAGFDTQANSVKEILSELSPADEIPRHDNDRPQEKEWLRMFQSP